MTTPPGSPPPPPGGPPPGAGEPAPQGGALPADVRNWGMAAHLSAFVQLVGVPSFVGPLVVWLIKREQHPFIDAQGKEALNFNISVLIYAIVAGVLALVLIGIPLLIIIGIAWLVLVIVAALKASNGEPYRYPLTIRLIS